MKKLAKIQRQEEKTREKIAVLQSLLKQIDGQRTEQENLQIIQQVRALRLSREELYAFIGGGELPPALAGAIGGTAADPESIYSRRGRKRRDGQNTAETTAEPDDTPEDEDEAEDGEGNNDGENAENTLFESEDIDHEE